MNCNEIDDGYYRVLTQHWLEDEDSKTGWTGTGWGEEDGYEMIDYIEVDKYGNATKALFKYSGPIYIGKQHAAYNIQAIFLGELIDIVKENPEKNFDELFKINDEFKKLNCVIEMLDEQFKIKESLK